MSKEKCSIVSIVIDDLGMHEGLTARAIKLDASVTLAFLPYAPNVLPQATLAASLGHEVLLHMPMEPLNPSTDPGPNALFVDLDLKEMLRRIRWAFAQIPHAIGLNNHMGSKFTADENAMATVIGEMKSRNLILLDSRTTPQSIATKLAHRRCLPHVQRDVFLDHDRSSAAIRKQLMVLEDIARKQGGALAIGHPYNETFNALEEWISGIETRDIILVPISEFTRRLGESC